jgi:hypothetical protein
MTAFFLCTVRFGWDARSMRVAGSFSSRRNSSSRVAISRVNLVVHALEMQQAVQHQDTNLITKRVPEALSLPRGGVERDGKVARVLFGDLFRSRKTEDIRWLVFAAKITVQLLDLRI